MKPKKLTPKKNKAIKKDIGTPSAMKHQHDIAQTHA
jgi:hypothetical protein